MEYLNIGFVLQCLTIKLATERRTHKTTTIQRKQHNVNGLKNSMGPQKTLNI